MKTKCIPLLLLLLAGINSSACASLVLYFEDAGASSTAVIVDNQPNGYGMLPKT